MPNSYFQFKQFTIHQDRCAMKVCTDACVFGAWVREKISGMVKAEGMQEPYRVLDIGGGTGLLTLMLAQDTNCYIDMVEIEAGAAQQAAENIAASAWKERIQVVAGDVRTAPLHPPYDVIVSNPPFFENDLKSADAARNLALHSEQLGLRDLIATAKKNLAAGGILALLLPRHRETACIDIAGGYELHPFAIARVSQTERHDSFRSMLLLGEQKTEPHIEEFPVRYEGQYSERVQGLLKDYYLFL